MLFLYILKLAYKNYGRDSFVSRDLIAAGKRKVMRKKLD